MIQKKFLHNAAAVILALAVWQAAAMLLDSKIILASPVDVIVRLCDIWREPAFFTSIWFSFSRICGGFLLGVAAGTLLAALAGAYPIAETLLRPLMVTVKSVPVASFIVIALVWLSSASLSVFISFLMVMPLVYTNILQGIKTLDPKMDEMACVFRMSRLRRLVFVRLPQLRPFIVSACSVAAGLAWKAGVAAEVIGRPDGSIGEQLYGAKIYLNTPDLFAWTVIIVAVSVAFEKLFIFLLDKALRGVTSL